MENKTIRHTESYSVERWDYVLKRWHHLKAFEKQMDAERMITSIKSGCERMNPEVPCRVIKTILTKEVVYEG